MELIKKLHDYFCASYLSYVSSTFLLVVVYNQAEIFILFMYICNILTFFNEDSGKRVYLAEK
jgi:hypothetical protein